MKIFIFYINFWFNINLYMDHNNVEVAKVITQIRYLKKKMKIIKHAKQSRTFSYVMISIVVGLRLWKSTVVNWSLFSIEWYILLVADCRNGFTKSNRNYKLILMTTNINSNLQQLNVQFKIVRFTITIAYRFFLLTFYIWERSLLCFQFSNFASLPGRNDHSRPFRFSPFFLSLDSQD